MIRWLLAISILCCSALPLSASAESASDIAATCGTKKNTESSGEGNDYPGMQNTVWRCMKGSVYVCEMGASGRGCMKGVVVPRRRVACSSGAEKIQTLTPYPAHTSPEQRQAGDAEEHGPWW